ncbi:hypothetical protein COEREDRAFT_89460 [Coemansia reversa NRRL 1564]|uniref:Uncharacterized protein n=1 Tax=Coemansia reversa (strain ATCC 12441 / NRRL 1564) TaxID=763665 RepID=A0A2G5B3L2_COERN|nr:hypothetical protein COEREDRAFT_89460 [Coemansia reversa NRRL 1564]|eukprot:PIA13596.1 hypothetical protein COEREDRAFT_89460 [Coemansia reversa NRRL 1564]
MSDEEVNKCLSSIRAEQSETSNDSSNTKEVKKPKIKIFIYSYIVCSTKENGDKLIVEDFDQFAEKAIESFVDPSDELSVGKTLELLKKQVNASRELTKEEEKK